MAHHFVLQLIHVVWSTKNLEYLIPHTTLDPLYGYLSKIIKSNDAKLYTAGGTQDHIHCLIALPPTLSLSTLMNLLKSNSSRWIKNQLNVDPKFTWQDGYTAFTVQYDRIESVCKYIRDDATRHQNLSHKDEINNLLKLQHIPYHELHFWKNTHSKLLMHMIWSTKNRLGLIDKSIRKNLYQYITDQMIQSGGTIHAIGGIEDHVHALVEVPRNKPLSDIVQALKTSSNHWISSQGSSYSDFAWQVGYGAFSISLSTKDAVTQYIATQEEHHKFVTPADEWNAFLIKKGLT